MDQTAAIISLLDRKYEFITDAPPENILLETCAFLTWLESDPETNPHITAIFESQKADHAVFVQGEAAMIVRLVAVKHQMIVCRPGLDDAPQVNALRQTNPIIFTARYDFSFAKFDDLVNGTLQVIWRDDYEQPYEDRSRVGGLLKILHSKLGQDETLSTEPAFATQYLDYLNLQNQHIYMFQWFANRRRLGATIAYVRLHRLRNFTNPKPPLFASLADHFQYLGGLGYAHERAAIRQTVYTGNVDEDLNRRAVRDARRLYEAIRQRIGTTHHHVALLHEYKVRCMHYDKARLRTLATTNTVEQRRNMEDRLALELATWLYDRGLPVAIKSNIQNLQPDLLGIEQGFLVEAKAYSGANRRELTQGLAQLHAYMNALEGSARYVQQAFYVVFRLAGQLVDLPKVIDTNRFRLHTLVIDLGVSADSGRRQPTPMVITSEQILDAIAQPNPDQAEA